MTSREDGEAGEENSGGGDKEEKQHGHPATASKLEDPGKATLLITGTGEEHLGALAGGWQGGWWRKDGQRDAGGGGAIALRLQRAIAAGAQADKAPAHCRRCRPGLSGISGQDWHFSGSKSQKEANGDRVGEKWRTMHGELREI